MNAKKKDEMNQEHCDKRVRCMDDAILEDEDGTSENPSEIMYTVNLCGPMGSDEFEILKTLITTLPQEIYVKVQMSQHFNLPDGDAVLVDFFRSDAFIQRVSYLEMNYVGVHKHVYEVIADIMGNENSVLEGLRVFVETSSLIAFKKIAQVLPRSKLKSLYLYSIADYVLGPKEKEFTLELTSALETPGCPLESLYLNSNFLDDDMDLIVALFKALSGSRVADLGLGRICPYVIFSYANFLQGLETLRINYIKSVSEMDQEINLNTMSNIKKIVVEGVRISIPIFDQFVLDIVKRTSTETLDFVACDIPRSCREHIAAKKRDPSLKGVDINMIVRSSDVEPNYFMTMSSDVLG